MSLRKTLSVRPRTKVDLSRIDSSAAPGRKGESALEREQAEAQLEANKAKLLDLQTNLYAENQRSLLIVLQGMDTSGKDGCIRHVMTGFNPQGCCVTSFKQPSAEELDHDFLWRIHKAIPAKGEVGVFNRSHYEDVLITRVHKMISKKTCEERYEVINRFERMLVDNGNVTILKFYLHISKEEQNERLQARLDDSKKTWKFSLGDLEERKLWQDYQQAYEAALSNCSVKNAPWYIIPADKKWYRDWAVSQIIRETLEEMNPKPPASDIDVKAIKFR